MQQKNRTTGDKTEKQISRFPRSLFDPFDPFCCPKRLSVRSRTRGLPVPDATQDRTAFYSCNFLVKKGEGGNLSFPYYRHNVHATSIDKRNESTIFIYTRLDVHEPQKNIYLLRVFMHKISQLYI